jgi:hypothetical protein
MKDIEEISKKVEKRKQQLQTLFNKDKENYDLWAGAEQKFDSHKMAINITGTEMTALGRRIQASLTRSRLDIHVLPPNPLPNSEAVETANREEDMYYHGFEMADEKLSMTGDASLLASATWQAVVLGRIAVRVLVYKDDDDEIVWDYLPMIPSLVTFSFDTKGLAWYNYETFRSAECISNEYGKEVTEEVEGKGISVSDHWDREHNVRYLTKDKEMLGKAWKHGLGFVPAIILPVTLGPKIITTEGIDVTAWGQSIYDHVKTPFRNLNMLRSVVATQAHLNAKAPLDIAYEDSSQLEEKHFDYYPGAILKHPKTETINPMNVKDVPPSILTMIGDINTGIQRATYTELSPDVPAHSGSALKILRQDMQDVLSPRGEALNKVYTGICRMVKRQILAQKLTIPVKTVVNDRYEIYDMKPKLLDNDFYVGAEFIRQDVYDEVEALQEAQLYQQNRWMSRETIMEKKLRMQDVPTEITKMDMDEVEAGIPELKLKKLIKKYQDMEMFEEAEMLKKQLAMLLIEKQQTIQNMIGGGMPSGATEGTAPSRETPRQGVVPGVPA